MTNTTIALMLKPILGPIFLAVMFYIPARCVLLLVKRLPDSAIKRFLTRPI